MTEKAEKMAESVINKGINLCTLCFSLFLFSKGYGKLDQRNHYRIHY